LQDKATVHESNGSAFVFGHESVLSAVREEVIKGIRRGKDDDQRDYGDSKRNGSRHKRRYRDGNAEDRCGERDQRNPAPSRRKRAKFSLGRPPKPDEPAPVKGWDVQAVTSTSGSMAPDTESGAGSIFSGRQVMNEEAGTPLSSITF